jgi:hypothetical protein
MIQSARIATVIGLALAIGPNMATADEICPKPLTGGGATNDGVYNITYKSWNWQEKSSWFFCYCVRNASASQQVYTEWQDVHLSGFVPPDAEIHTYSPYDSDNSVVVSKRIWYGLGLKPAVYPTLLPKLSFTDRPILEGPFVASREGEEFQLADYDTAVSEHGVESEGLIYLPVLFEGTSSKADIIKGVESGKLPTVPFSMKFESAWEIDRDTHKAKILYTCGYDSPLLWTRMFPGRRSSGLWMSIIDKTVHRALFGTSDDVPLGNYERPISVYRGSLSTDSPGEELQLVQSAMEIKAAGSDSVIGSIPIRLYVPKHTD